MDISQLDPSKIKVVSQPNEAAPAAMPTDISQLDPNKIQFSAPTPDYAEQAKAGLESFGRGATFNLSDIAEAKSGLATPEDIKAREEKYPGTNLVGTGLGAAATTWLTGGVAGPLEATLGHAGALAAEGAAYGAGSLASDAALGDPNLNAQKVLTTMGLSTALGYGIGSLSKGIQALPSLWRSAGEGAVEGAVSDAPSVAPIASRNPTPTTFDEMANRVADAKAKGIATDLPQRGVLADAMSRIEMENPVHPLQMNSLENQQSRDLYKIAQELPGKEGDAIRGYESLQKNELVNKTEQAIEGLSPEFKPTSDAAQGGERAIKAFTEQYQAEKSALKPVFDALKNTEVGHDIDHLPGVIKAFTDAVPGVARMFDTEAPEISMLPYKSSWGIDKATYNAVKESVEALKDNPETFEDLANIRRGLDQHVNVLDQGQAPSQIRALKASMMDYMQKALDTQSHNFEVRNIFKDWAINEQERSVIEKAFGASVGSPEFGAISKIKPEVIGDRIFGNTANVKAAKAILEPAKFNEILANWLSEAKAGATDKGVFSSNKFGSFLRKNQDALNEAFRDNPMGLQRLKDLTTIMRILPDSASVNPSGSDKTLYGMLSKVGGFIAHPTEVPGKVLHGLGEKLEQWQVKQQLNAELAGKAEQAAKLKTIQSMADKTTNVINIGAKSVFNPSPLSSAANASLNKVVVGSYEEKTGRIQELATNPQMMMDHLADNTEALAHVAPNVTQGIHTTMMTAVTFLNGKIPRPPNQLFLSPKWKPSEAQKQMFNTYYQAVNDPVSVFKQIKTGTLSSPTMEALSTVHPQLLQEMKQKVTEHMTADKASELDYGTKMSISKFLGMPLDENMLPGAVASNQATFTGPQLSQEAPQGAGRKQALGPMKNIKLSSRSAPRSSQEAEES